MQLERFHTAKGKNEKRKLKNKEVHAPPHSLFLHPRAGLALPETQRAFCFSLRLQLLQGLSLQFHRFPCTLWLSIGVTGSGSLEDRQSLRNTLEPWEEEKVVEQAAQAPADDWAHPVHLWEESRQDQTSELFREKKPKSRHMLLSCTQLGISES